MQSFTEYSASFPPPVRARLIALRNAIAGAAPKANEKMAYGVPTFTLNGKNLVHFGAFKKHIGFYPGVEMMRHYDTKLSRYTRAKGSVQFPFEKPLPLSLIRTIVRHRVALLSIHIKKQKPK